MIPTAPAPPAASSPSPSHLQARRDQLDAGRRPSSPGKLGGYPAWWTNILIILPWKDPPFFMGKSTKSMAIFHCYVTVHQRLSNEHDKFNEENHGQFLTASLKWWFFRKLKDDFTGNFSGWFLWWILTNSKCRFPNKTSCSSTKKKVGLTIKLAGFEEMEFVEFSEWYTCLKLDGSS